MSTFALILAGGRGNRFWPRSSPALPKQFLRLLGKESLLQATYQRARGMWADRDIYVVATAAYENLVRWQLPALPRENLFLEPAGRDTAAAVGYAFIHLGEARANDVAVVFPADHYVAAGASWAQTITVACHLAAAGHPVLVGIEPARPETSFGYILLGEPVASLAVPAYQVARFIEKPDAARASQLLRQGHCLWNSGMFIWRVNAALALLERYLPATMAAVTRTVQWQRQEGNRNDRSSLGEEIKKCYATIPAISLDYGVIEKAAGVIVVRGDFPWDDLGGWPALERLNPRDALGNVICGNALLQDTEGCLVDCAAGPAVIIGVKDTIIASHEGRLLVCTRDKLAQLKGLLNSPAFVAIQQRAAGDQQATLPEEAAIVLKPWGREIWWAVTEAYAAKILEVKAGQATSLHLHQQKQETFYGQSGQGYLILNDVRKRIEPGVVVTIPPQARHRLFALTDLRIIEVSTPHLDDVTRLEDDYGRQEVVN